MNSKLQYSGSTGRRDHLFLLSCLTALVAFPFLLPQPFLITVVTEAMIFGIAAMSLDLMLGYTGLASFCHAALFGIGAYAGGLVGVHLTAALPITLGVAVLAAALLALVVGSIAIRAEGIYFIFLTLALSQVVFAIVFKWRSLTGGDDGLSGVPRPSLGGLDRFVDTGDDRTFYFLVLMFFVLSYVLLRRVVSSAFGTVLVGIRENPTRMAAIGYRVKIYKVAAFVISGAFAGLAGGLFVQEFSLVSPNEVQWQTSAILLIMVVLGGAGSLIGPALGALIIVLLQNVVSSYTQRWPMIMAVMFIAVVLFLRGGIWGQIRRVLPYVGGG
jgi:branched-chain amino acid transport system permease protein